MKEPEIKESSSDTSKAKLLFEGYEKSRFIFPPHLKTKNISIYTSFVKQKVNTDFKDVFSCLYLLVFDGLPLNLGHDEIIFTYKNNDISVSYPLNIDKVFKDLFSPLFYGAVVVNVSAC